MTTTTVDLAADAESFHRFHTVDLPARLANGNGALAFGELAPLGTLAISTPVGTYTYVPRDGTVEVLEGDADADTVVEMDLDSWLGLISDLDTAPSLFYGGRISATKGKPLRFVRWEPGLRAMFHGLPPFDPETADLRGPDGEPLDPTRVFDVDDLRMRPDEMRHFLTTAGYLVVRNAFDAETVAEMLSDASVLHDEARPGDGASWWGRDADGTEVLCRVLNANRSDRFRALIDHPRLERLVALAPERLVSRDPEEIDSATVLWKLPDVTEGLADLPWHRDCGMGGHALNCPTIVVTVCLTDGGPEAGELRVLPGSHRGTFPFIDGRDERAPEGVPVAVAAGDVSLHYSDLMHASLPPTSAAGPHRVSALVAFVPPTTGHHRDGRHYNDALLAGEDGQVEHLGHRLKG